MQLRCLAVVVLPVLVATAVAQAPEWPGFRGPHRDGTAPGAKPPLKWSDSDNLTWKAELPGPGASSPIVVGDRIYVTCYSGYGVGDDFGEPKMLMRHLVCVRRSDGKILVDREVPGPRNKDARGVQLNEHGFASPTPVTDGKVIYAYFGNTGVVAFDLEGQVLWESSLGTVPADAPTPTNQIVRDGEAISLRWGSAASPLLYEGLVIVNASEQSDSIRALDASNGDLVWQRHSPNLQGSAISPILVGRGDERVLVIGLAGEVWGLSPVTGGLLWRVETETRGGMSPSPVADEQRVYTFGGAGKSFALRFAGNDGEEASSRVAWQGVNIGVPSPILWDGRLFLIDESGKAVCLKAESGEVVFRERLDGRTGKIYASPVLADDRLYVVSQKRGTFIYSADGKFELMANNQIASDDSKFNASPVMVGNQLFLRSNKYLYCFTDS